MTTRNIALQVVGAVAGIALGAYSGMHLLIPLAATGMLWWAGRRLLSAPRQRFLPPAAVQGGHLLWLAFGLVGSRVLDASMLDLLIMAIGVAWLVARPGLGPVVLLTLYQGLALLINAAGFLEAEPGSVIHKALLIHIIWRLLAVALMWQAYVKSGRGTAS